MLGLGRKKRDGEISALENMIAQKDDDIKVLGRKLANVIADRDAAESEIGKVQDALIAAQRDLEDAAAEIASITESLADNQAIIRTMHSTAEKLRHHLEAEQKSNHNLRDRLSAENLRVTKLEAANHKLTDENKVLSDQVSDLMVQSNAAANSGDNMTSTTKLTRKKNGS